MLLIKVLKYIYQIPREILLLSEEEVEENLALILNFHLLEFGGYSSKQEIITFYPWELCYKELYSVLFQ